MNILAKTKLILSKGAKSISLVDIISSYFGGSSLAKVVTKLAINRLPLFNTLFPKWYTVPGFTKEIAISKSGDMVEFFLIILFSSLLFIFLTISSSIFSKKQNIFLSTGFLFINLLLFIETTFLSFSAIRVVVSLVVAYILYGLVKAKDFKGNKIKFAERLFLNGLLLGFYLTIFSLSVTASVSIPLMFLFVFPFVYLAFSGTKSEKILKSPLHLLFALSAFFAYKPVLLVILGVIFILSVFGASFLSLELFKKRKLTLIYSFVFVFVLCYNPLFYFGNFDPIEEGFWLGWLERLLRGGALYRDVAVYHPPGFIWGLFLFSKITTPSVYVARLYFEILRVLGLFVIFVAASKIIKNKILKYIVFGTILVATQSLVRNNVEIRVALGLLPILLITSFNLKKKLGAFLSGFFALVAVFFSIEVGLASFLVCLLYFVFGAFKDKRPTEILYFILGALAGALPFVGVLYLTFSLKDFLSQLFFYTSAFSNGYLNSSFPVSGGLTLIHWNIIYGYLDSLKWFWELSLLSLMLSALVIAKRALSGGKYFGQRLAILVLVYGLLLTRVVLGRSDIYHLFFVLPVSLLLLGYILESTSKKYSSYITISVFAFLTLYFFRNFLNLGYLENQLVKYQSYAKLPGNYPFYDLKRANFTTDIDTDIKKEKELITYIASSTKEDESIFVYPINPEIYFLSDRANATSFDTPLAFFALNYQEKMVAELERNSPKLVIYNADTHLAGLGAKTLLEVDNYIKANYTLAKEIGDQQILLKNAVER